MPKQPPEVIVVAGPTATGKTRVGASIAKHLGSEVISADSQLVYQELSIGVAKPTAEEMHGVVHHMIDVVTPTEQFSAGQYADMARPILERLLSEGRSPVVVGGTGFYIRALLQPGHIPQVPVDEAYRAQLRDRLAEEGPEALYQELLVRDPQRASQLHPNDTVRVIRALEIIEATGKPVEASPVEPVYPTRAIGLRYADRERQWAQINRRLEAMMAEGFLEEARQVYGRYGFCEALHNAHGYPELIQVLEGQRTLEDAIGQIQINIRQYSKRQLTWFNRFPGIQWYCVDQMGLDEVVTDVVALYR